MKFVSTALNIIHKSFEKKLTEYKAVNIWTNEGIINSGLT